MKKTKKTFEQEPSGVYKEQPCDKCGDTMRFIPTARIYLCTCGNEDISEEEIVKFTDSIKIEDKLYSK